MRDFDVFLVIGEKKLLKKLSIYRLFKRILWHHINQ